MSKQIEIAGFVIGICLGACLAKEYGINQEVIDTGTILCCIVMLSRHVIGRVR